jgi:DNA-binding transcriptional LysR family regulator
MDLLDQMATFVRVVETGSLSGAARARKLSLASVSRQLGALERDLGATLVARTTRRLRVTDAGRRYYDHCATVLRDVDEGRAAVRGDRLVVGPVVVSAPVTVGASLVVPRLPALLAAHPALVVDLRLEDRLVDLVSDAVDVAIRGGVAPPDSPSIVARTLARFERVLVASPSYLAKRRAPKCPADLVRHACLVQAGPTDRAARWTLRIDDDTSTVAVRGPIRSTSPAALLDLAVRGVGIAFLPSWLAADALRSGALAPVLPRHRSLPVSVVALYRAELRGAPRIEAVLAALSGLGEREGTDAAGEPTVRSKSPRARGRQPAT